MQIKKMTNKEMYVFSCGEVIRSLAENGVNTFVLLYFSSALGLNPTYAGLAISLSIGWDAITDPLMGYISDNTFSKYGKRVPYILGGGIMLILLMYLYWHVPTMFTESQQSLFAYLVFVNILFKTFFTIYFVPYGALAMDLVTDFNGRTKIQSSRQSFNMLANFFGPGISWFIFFPRAEDVLDVAQYEKMGNYFVIVASIALVITILYLRKHIVPSIRPKNMESKSKFRPKHIASEYLRVLRNKYMIILFAFAIVSYLSYYLMCNLQTYMYSYYMLFSGFEKTVVNGGTMLASAAGAAFGAFLATRTTKRHATMIACLIGSLSCFGLLALLLTGVVVPQTTVGTIIFAIGNSGFWFGMNMTIPLTFSMLADVAEVSFLQTKKQQEGTFMSVFSFTTKLAGAFAGLFSGILITLCGFDVGVAIQESDTLTNLSIATFGLVPVIMLTGIIVMYFYSLSYEKLKDYRRKLS